MDGKRNRKRRFARVSGGVKMKKILLVCMVFLLVGCNSNLLEEKVVELENDAAGLQTKVNQLETEKLALFEQIAEGEEVKRTAEEKLVKVEEQLINAEKIIDVQRAKVTELEESLSAYVSEDDVYAAQQKYDVQLFSSSNGRYNYLLVQSETDLQSTIVIGEGEVNQFDESKDQKLSYGEGLEGVSLFIEGKIYNFKWVKINWNDDYSEFEVGDVMEALDYVSNRRIDVLTILPEGLPSESIQWENSEGEVFNMFLSYDGYGFEGNIIIGR